LLLLKHLSILADKRDKRTSRATLGALKGDPAADGAAEPAAFALLLKKRVRRLGHFAKCPLAIQRLGSARKKGGLISVARIVACQCSCSVSNSRSIIANE